MNRSKRPYSVHKRPTVKKSRFIYYVKFRDLETGTYLSAVSSGCSSKSSACNWADEQIRLGLIPHPGKRDLTFSQYAVGFWDWETSQYIHGKLARGSTFSRTYAHTAEGYVRIHIEPTFGKVKLTEITSKKIEKWLVQLYESGTVSPSSINKYLSVFRIMLKDAFLNGFIPSDPGERVSEVAEKRVDRGILTPTEARALLDPTRIHEIWGGSKQYYAANLLAATTGMRAGEIRALMVKHIFPDRIEVFHSWEEKFGIKGAKWNSERVVPIPQFVHESLLAIIMERGDLGPEDLVFAGKNLVRPLSKRVFMDTLIRALERIGVDKQQRKTRNITFHSWRHYFNSFCRGKVSDAKLRLVTGHRTEEMTDRYTHFVEEDFSDIREIQKRIYDIA